jgi:UDP-N-acetylglucosamine--N-acetylmuramyl-(pentapeptide) pyrophosphoryl-undecaprenol N-acetylglucosamine transferase
MPTSRDATPRVILTGGGTGGHVYPALAVATALRKLRPSVEFLYIGGDRMEATAVPQAGLPFCAIAVHGLAGGVSWGRRLRSLAELAAGIPLAQSLGILRGFRPEVVIGTGGYVSGPVLAAARLRRVPALALDGNRTPGYTSRLACRLVDIVAVAHPEMADFFSRRIRRGARVEVTGLPVRPEVVEMSREKALEALGLDPSRFTLLIFGGSLGSQRVNEAAAGALDRLAEVAGRPEMQVLHVTGRRYAGDGGGERWAGLGYRSVPYVGAEALAAADLVVSRAGASSVAEITARGLPSVLIPWAQASTGEQVVNAQPLAEAGAAIVIPDGELTGERLGAALAEVIASPDRRAKMAAASRGLGRPRAAERVAELALELAGRKRRDPG